MLFYYILLHYITLHYIYIFVYVYVFTHDIQKMKRRDRLKWIMFIYIYIYIHTYFKEKGRTPRYSVVETVFFLPVVFPWTTSWWFNHQHIFDGPWDGHRQHHRLPNMGIFWCRDAIDLKFKTTSKKWGDQMISDAPSQFFRWLARSQGEKVLKTDISGLQQLSKTCVQAKMASGFSRHRPELVGRACLNSNSNKNRM